MRRPAFPTRPPEGPTTDQMLPAGRWLRLQPHILLFAGFAIGASSGTLVEFYAPNHPLTFQFLTWVIRPVEQVFLSVLFLLIAPLLFSAIVSGLSRIRGNAGMPGLLATTLAYMLAVSAAAALIGLAMANLFRPGDGIPPEVGQQLVSPHVPPLAVNLMNLVPSYRSVNGWILAMVILSFAIGMALPLLRKQSGNLLLAACEQLFAIGMRIVTLVTRFAPVAVACFMFDMTVMFGWHLLIYLSAYVVVVIAALALQIVITFFIVVWMRGDLAPSTFLRSVQEAALIAFSTSSSNATLPTALKVAEIDLGLPGRVVRPVLGLGTVSNQSGTAIYIAVTVLFVGQFFGMDLSLDRQALVFAIATLAGMGTMGVPAGALPAVATVLALTGLPPEGIGLVIGVDRLLDMFRTLVNVVGDLAISVAISRESVVSPREVSSGDTAIASHDLP
ncbi:dicarboxylate/amino acid:cation symporter [Novosphingobium mangrovi (ex Huang et al. 2023)]|uniref:Dicarboxylate/amino acid:cation symporter n=1 Tax=Novosphingobium mangrovi (ex Huang et al. 2023) TaxID=2976432 RepID=A0ABT2I9L1_9SPHN|nr:dicarboxylate/amino acid:cation symporter [Novosphingobium mangrovi (ex Huang et al. 2023)]MCT2401514.1 dicarboxylate/amino acid:cation symporter [Novosphingobium mangrovi (ex Huang et al. 2023)]